MDTIMEGPERSPDKTAVQRSGGGGMLILPWTKQILCVLWEHLRLLLHVVYYSFLAVFQMFRLEVHLRITDEGGRARVQHVSSAGSPADFLSSLFDGNSGVFIPSSESLSKGGLNAYAGGSHAGGIVSSFRAEDLCLSLVDDFVTCAQEGLSGDGEDELTLGHHPSWTRSAPGNCEVRVSGECQPKEEPCSRGAAVEVPTDCDPSVTHCDPSVLDCDPSVTHCDPSVTHCDPSVLDCDPSVTHCDPSVLHCDPSVPDCDPSVPDCDPSVTHCDPSVTHCDPSVTHCDPSVTHRDPSVTHCDPPVEAMTDSVEEGDSFWDEEDTEGEEAEEEFDALWDSFTKSCDPYNPLSFSACISTCSDSEGGGARKGKLAEGGGASDGGWASEGGGASEAWGREGPTPQEGLALQTRRWYHLDPVWPGRESGSDWDSSDSSTEDDDDDDDGDGDEEENERLWELFANPPDPYSPLHFTACAGVVRQGGLPRPGNTTPPSDSGESDGPSEEEEGEEEEELWNSFSQSADPYHPLHFRACLQSTPTAPPLPGRGRSKPRLPNRLVTPHCCLHLSQQPRRLTPWKRPGSSPAANHKAQTPSPKKVRFSPLVQVHVMRAWSFAMRAVRRGPWEESGRDRARFQRRIQETEHAIGYCLHQSHREKMLDYLSCRPNLPFEL